MDRIRVLHLKLNPDKCHFRVSEVQFVGHLLTDMGVKLDPGKTEAVILMPPPEDKLGLQWFLGMTNYLSNVSNATATPLLEPLYQDVEWC